MCCSIPQRLGLAQACGCTTSTHDTEIETREPARVPLSELDSNRHPREGHDELGPPRLISLLIRLLGSDILGLCRAAIAAFIALQLSLARQSDEVAGNTQHPRAVAPRVDFRRLALGGSRPLGRERCWQHLRVREQGHIFQELEG